MEIFIIVLGLVALAGLLFAEDAGPDVSKKVTEVFEDANDMVMPRHWVQANLHKLDPSFSITDFLLDRHLRYNLPFTNTSFLYRNNEENWLDEKINDVIFPMPIEAHLDNTRTFSNYGLRKLLEFDVDSVKYGKKTAMAITKPVYTNKAELQRWVEQAVRDSQQNEDTIKSQNETIVKLQAEVRNAVSNANCVERTKRHEILEAMGVFKFAELLRKANKLVRNYEKALKSDTDWDKLQGLKLTEESLDELRTLVRTTPKEFTYPENEDKTNEDA